MSVDTNYMVKQIIEKLIDTKIVNICTDADGYFGLVLEDDKGNQKTAFINCDAEGNAPGWLDIHDDVPDWVTLGGTVDLERYIRETPAELLENLTEVDAGYWEVVPDKVYISTGNAIYKGREPSEFTVVTFEGDEIGDNPVHETFQNAIEYAITL